VHSVEDAPLPESFVRQMKERGAVYITTAMVFEGYRDAFLGSPDLTSIERRLGAPDVIASLYEMPDGVVSSARESMPPDSLKQIAANAKAMVAGGARVAAGTDAGNIGTVHGPAIHRELQLLAGAGLTPAQVLTAATRDAAFAFAAKPDIGLVAPGYRADLLVLDADPLKSISALTRINRLWSKGRVLDPAKLVQPSPESVVELQLERYNAHDLEGFLATYADNAEIFDSPGRPSPSLSGKPALRKVYGQLFQGPRKPTCRAAQRVVEGPYVIDQEVCVMGAGETPLHAAAIYYVVDGQIRRVWFADAKARAIK
jgi:hypothetical protein